MSEEFEDYFTEVENSLSQCAGGRDLYALKLAHKNYFRIKTGFYEMKVLKKSQMRFVCQLMKWLKTVK